MESFPISHLERAEAGYSVAVSGVERARLALAEARKRAEIQAETYQAELLARIKADQAKRVEVLAELAQLRAETTSEREITPETPPLSNLESGEPSL